MKIGGAAENAVHWDSVPTSDLSSSEVVSVQAHMHLTVQGGQRRQSSQQGARTLRRNLYTFRAACAPDARARQALHSSKKVWCPGPPSRRAKVPCKLRSKLMVELPRSRIGLGLLFEVHRADRLGVLLLREPARRLDVFARLTLCKSSSRSVQRGTCDCGPRWQSCEARRVAL